MGSHLRPDLLRHPGQRERPAAPGEEPGAAGRRLGRGKGLSTPAVVPRSHVTILIEDLSLFRAYVERHLKEYSQVLACCPRYLPIVYQRGAHPAIKRLKLDTCSILIVAYRRLYTVVYVSLGQMCLLEATLCESVCQTHLKVNLNEGPFAFIAFYDTATKSY